MTNYRIVGVALGIPSIEHVGMSPWPAAIEQRCTVEQIEFRQTDDTTGVELSQGPGVKPIKGTSVAFIGGTVAPVRLQKTDFPNAPYPVRAGAKALTT